MALVVLAATLAHAIAAVAAGGPGDAQATSTCAGPPAAISHARPDPKIQFIADLPESVELVVVFDRASDLRRDAHGRSVEHLLEATGLTRGWKDVWEHLADEVGFPEDEAFDRLVGQRLVLVVRGLESDQARRFALISRISAETDAQLRSRLKAAPRSVRNDLQVMSVETGRYLLASTRLKGDDRITAVLGPADRPELFQDCLDSLSGTTGRTLGQTPVMEAAQQAFPADVLLLLRVDPMLRPPVTPPTPWTDYFVLGTHADRTGYSADLIFRDSELVEQLARVEASSSAAFDRLQADALGAVVEWPLVAEPGVTGPAIAAESKLSSAPAESGRIDKLEGFLSFLGVPAELRELLGQRQAVVIKASDASPGISVAFAIELNQAPEAARTGDRFIAETIRRLETVGMPQTASTEPLQLADFEGLEPAAVRTVPINAPALAMLSTVLARTPVVAWAYPSRPCNACTPGWWVVAVTPTQDGSTCAAANLVRHASEALLLTREQAARQAAPGDRIRVERWLSLGSLRPADFERAVTRAIPDEFAWRAVLGAIDSLAWEVFVGDNNDVHGSLRMNLRDPEPTAPR